MQHSADGCLELREIVFDSRRDNGVRCIEIPMGKLVSHLGDVRPWNPGFTSHEIR